MKKQIELFVLFLLINFTIILATIFFFQDGSNIPVNIFRSFLITRTMIGVFISLVFYALFKIQITTVNLHLFLIAGLMFLVSYFFETYSFILVNSKLISLQNGSQYLFIGSQLLITTAPFIFMYFVVTFFRSIERTYLAFFPVLFDVLLETVYQPLSATITITTIVLDDIALKYWVYQPITFWINIVYFLSIAWLVVYLSYLIYQSRKISIDPLVIEQQNIFFLAIFTIFIIAPIIFYVNIFITNPLLRFYWISIVGRSFVVLGMTFFILKYYRSSQKIDYFQPQPLEAFFIINAQTGEIIYSKKFIMDYEWEILELVVTNVTIINKMLGDALGISSLISSIHFIDKELLINTLPDLDVICILVVRTETKVIHDRYVSLLSKLQNGIEIEKTNLEKLIQMAFSV